MLMQRIRIALNPLLTLNPVNNLGKSLFRLGGEINLIA